MGCSQFYIGSVELHALLRRHSSSLLGYRDRAAFACKDAVLPL